MPARSQSIAVRHQGEKVCTLVFGNNCLLSFQDLMNREKKDKIPSMQVSFIDAICTQLYQVLGGTSIPSKGFSGAMTEPSLVEHQAFLVLSKSLSLCRRWLACRSIAPRFWKAVRITESSGSVWPKSARKAWLTARCEPLTHPNPSP